MGRRTSPLGHITETRSWTACGARCPDWLSRYIGTWAPSRASDGGDKYPQYADGDLDPQALQTIDRLFPESQYVRIIRDPRAVVSSILAKGWLEFDEAIGHGVSSCRMDRDFGTSVGEGEIP